MRPASRELVRYSSRMKRQERAGAIHLRESVSMSRYAISPRVDVRTRPCCAAGARKGLSLGRVLIAVHPALRRPHDLRLTSPPKTGGGGDASGLPSDPGHPSRALGSCQICGIEPDRADHPLPVLGGSRVDVLAHNQPLAQLQALRG
jgi:hypothetical protein